MASTCITPTLPALLLGAVLSLGWSGPVSAQSGLTDPTRPPALLAGPARTGDTVQAAAASRRATNDNARTPRPAAAAPQLQSLQLPRNGGTPSALIDGRLLHIGERLGDWTVQAIDADAVWLRRGHDPLQRLALLPALNPSATPARRPDDTEAPLHLATTAAATATAPRNASPRKEP
jgi:hypothetical protein